jgi:hypothetical protein
VAGGVLRRLLGVCAAACGRWLGRRRRRRLNQLDGALDPLQLHVPPISDGTRVSRGREDDEGAERGLRPQRVKGDENLGVQRRLVCLAVDALLESGDVLEDMGTAEQRGDGVGVPGDGQVGEVERACIVLGKRVLPLGGEASVHGGGARSVAAEREADEVCAGAEGGGAAYSGGETGEHGGARGYSYQTRENDCSSGSLRLGLAPQSPRRKAWGVQSEPASTSAKSTTIRMLPEGIHAVTAETREQGCRMPLASRAQCHVRRIRQSRGRAGWMWVQLEAMRWGCAPQHEQEL